MKKHPLGGSDKREAVGRGAIFHARAAGLRTPDLARPAPDAMIDK